MDDALIEVLQACAKLNALGYVKAVGFYVDGTPHYELTDKGRMVLAEYAWESRMTKKPKNFHPTKMQRNINKTFSDVLWHSRHCTKKRCIMCQPLIGA